MKDTFRNERNQSSAKREFLTTLHIDVYILSRTLDRSTFNLIVKIVVQHLASRAHFKHIRLTTPSFVRFCAFYIRSRHRRQSIRTFYIHIYIYHRTNHPASDCPSSRSSLRTAKSFSARKGERIEGRDATASPPAPAAISFSMSRSAAELISRVAPIARQHRRRDHTNRDRGIDAAAACRDSHRESPTSFTHSVRAPRILEPIFNYPRV